MFQVLRNAWKIADLRKKILYTLLIILIFRHRLRMFPCPLWIWKS